METIKLLSNQVLLKLIDPDQQTKGKLWIPEVARQDKENHALYRGEVVATGPGAVSKRGYRTPCDVQPGDTVQFYWLAGNADVTQWPTENHRIIREDYIQCVIQ